MEKGSEDLLVVAREELRLREKIVWYCQPNAMHKMLRGFGVWIFMVPWTGFSSYFVYKTVNQESMEPVSLLFSLMFPAVGVLVMLTPFYEWAKAKKTIHIVTNQRVFTIQYLRTLKILNIDLEKISNIEKKIGSSGFGDLILYKDYYLDSDKDKQEKEHGFFAIADVREAEKHVIKLLDSTRYNKQVNYVNASDNQSDESSSGNNKKQFIHVKEDELEAQLDDLYMKYNDAKGSRKYVLQVKIIERLDKKKEHNFQLSNQDSTFLSEISASQSKLNIQELVNPQLVGWVAVAVVVVLFFLGR